MTQRHEIDRRLDPAEAFYFLLDRLAGANFVVFAERVGQLDAPRVRAALNVVQEQDPLLRVSVTSEVGIGLRFEPSAAPIPLEVINTSGESWLGFIEQELAQSFAEGTAPLMRCLLLQWTGRSVLALTFQHAIGDARAGIETLRRTLQYAAVPGSEAPPFAPLPPMHAVFPERFRWDVHPETAEQVHGAVMRDLLTSVRRSGRPARLPWLDSRALQRTPRVRRLVFPPEFLERLLRASRAHDASVHGVLCAAHLLATYRLLATSAETALFLSCPIDLRPHLDPAQPVAPTGQFVTVITATVAIEPSTDVWALAGAITTRTRMQLARGDGHLFFRQQGLDKVATEADGMARFGAMIMDTPEGVSVSNVGRVSSVASDPAVDGVSFVVCPQPYQSVFSAVTTYGDRLFVNLTCDVGKQTEATAQATADYVRELLLAAGA